MFFDQKSLLEHKFKELKSMKRVEWIVLGNSLGEQGVNPKYFNETVYNFSIPFMDLRNDIFLCF